MRELPEGWSWTSLGEVSSKPQYGWTTKGTEKGRVKLLRTTDIAGGSPHWPSVPFCAEDPPEPAKYRLTNGDIVISRAGSVGVSALLQPPLPLAVFASYLIRFKVTGVAPEYIALYLQTPDYWKAISKSASGIAMPNVNAKKLAALSVPVAPSAEQPRIVTRVEALFAELDEGTAALKRAEVSLERYRASILKAAVDGRLTERWRSDNPPDETGEELLRRILRERRKRWEEEQLAAFATKSRKPPRNWKSRYKEPLAPDTSDLPALPDGWCWATVDQIGRVGSGITKGGTKREAARRAVPYLRVANVQRGFLDLRVVKTIPASEDEVRRYLLASGDVLFNEGGDRDKLGRGCVWRGEIPECLHQNHVFRVRLFHRGCSPDLLSHYGNSMGREWFFRKASQSVNLASINQTALRSLPVPLAPLREQDEIVRRLADWLGALERAGAAIGGQLRRAAALRQSILKCAFEGRLIPQDPDDEPAAVLLERIRAAREA